MLNRLLLAFIVSSLLVPMNVQAWPSNNEQTQQIQPPVVFDCDSDPKGDC